MRPQHVDAPIPTLFPPPKNNHIITPNFVLVYRSNGAPCRKKWKDGVVDMQGALFDRVEVEGYETKGILQEM